MIRLHTSSTGLEPRALKPGRDLVLELHPVHGTDVPDGVYVLDHLDPAARAAADRAAVEAHEAWRAGLDATAEGLDWGFVWMLEVHRFVNGAVARALALRAALRSAGATGVELADTDPGTARLATAVAGALGLEVRRDPSAREPQAPETVPAPLPRATKARRSAARAVTRLGTPSHLRRGAVAFHAYWPLSPLLDRVLADPARRPAVFLAKRPAGGSRSLAALRRGGWIGTPTPLDRARARPTARRLVAAVRARDSFVADGLELGPWLHPRLVAAAEGRAVEDLALLASLRRAFRGGRASWVLGCYDVTPDARVLVHAAREHGVRTLMLCHGAYLLPQPFGDLDVCDEVALWTRAVAPAMTDWDRPIHEVGYPLPHDPPPPQRPRPDRPPVIGVLGQQPVRTTCTLDQRITMRTYETALRAIERRFPGATVWLRPHPSQDRAASPEVVRRFGSLDVRESSGGDIVEFHRSVDLCLGSASTATLQAPLAGTPVIALNLSGTEWPFPLGDGTAVPVARSEADLDAHLERWDRERTLPGGEDLLAALGADGSDAVDRLLDVLDGRAPRPAATPAARGAARSAAGS